jgi:hypothetical protein
MAHGSHSQMGTKIDQQGGTKLRAHKIHHSAYSLALRGSALEAPRPRAAGTRLRLRHATARRSPHVRPPVQHLGHRRSRLRPTTVVEQPRARLRTLQTPGRSEAVSTIGQRHAICLHAIVIAWTRHSPMLTHGTRRAAASVRSGAGVEGLRGVPDYWRGETGHAQGPATQPETGGRACHPPTAQPCPLCTDGWGACLFARVHVAAVRDEGWMGRRQSRHAMAL